MSKDDLCLGRRSTPRHWLRPAAVLCAAALVGTAATVTGLAAGASASSRGVSAAASGKSGFLACEVTDTGGIGDRSFNASAYQGLKDAAKVIKGLTYRYASSQTTSDYVPNINDFLKDNCGIIVTVGYDMATATQNEAKKNPNQKFAIVDYTYSPPIKNVTALLYETNQDAFLGGYLAAAMSKSGAVGTFGGQNIPTVDIYMDGWVAGVRYYDKMNHATVKALGWTPKPGDNYKTGNYKGNGLFTNDFTNQALGRQDAQTLMSEGADIIFPVAGGVGEGAAAAVKAAGGSNYMEWVDTDGCVSYPQYCSLFITSVTKGIAPSVANAVESAAKGTFKGGNYVGTLANQGVSLSPYHDFAGKVPAKVTSALATIKAGIIAGKISLNPLSYPAP